jgi:hypothetical protein
MMKSEGRLRDLEESKFLSEGDFTGSVRISKSMHRRIVRKIGISIEEEKEE